MSENSELDKAKFEEFIGKSYSKRRYYTPRDVAQHFTAGDIWVTINSRVLDISHLIQENIKSELCTPLIEHAGKDISHFFNKLTNEPLTKVDCSTGMRAYYCPKGRYLHIPPLEASAIEEPTPSNGIPWWKDDNYLIGHLSMKVRKVRVINMLTHQEDIIECPSEESIEEIQNRYLVVNDHAESYTWKSVTNKPLDMEGTLDENDIYDETDRFESLGIPEDEWYIPPILIYFNDDLTEA